jgi:L-ascorbate metabolism protein UlaG (beta-lactamase superfamily)
MDYREAAELAAAVGATVLLPGHNDMFAGNRINPAYLLDYLATHHPGQRVHFLKAGELYYYAG